MTLLTMYGTKSIAYKNGDTFLPIVIRWWNHLTTIFNGRLIIGLPVPSYEKNILIYLLLYIIFIHACFLANL